MEKKDTSKTSNVQILLESIVAFLLVFILTITDLLSPLDFMFKDKIYQIPRGIDSNIKIIAIDEKTISELGQIQTWSRKQYADLVDKLNSNENMKPAIIGFDIMFTGNVDEDGDKAFAKSCEENGNVVVVNQFLYNERPEYDAKGNIVYPIDSIVFPYEELRNVTKQGYSNVSMDSDGKVRRISPYTAYEDVNYYSFSKIIFDSYCESMNIENESEFRTDKYGRTLINYSGKPGDYEAISFVDVINGTVDSAIFADSIVLVGAYATGMQDNFNVPNGYNEQMYGVEIHANIVQSYMQGRFSINANVYLVGLITALIAAVIHFVFRKNKIWLSLCILLLTIVINVLVAMWLNNQGYCISLIYLPLIMILSYVYCVAMGYIMENIKRKKVLNAFKKYVAPEVVDEIAANGNFNIKLGGENRDIAVLFVDIRGFTTMSEVLEPEQIVEILNRYLSLTTASIFKNKGTLDKFVGDATMAVFNSPFDLDDYELRAVRAAMDIVEGGAALEDELQKEFGRTVGFGVGVNVGPAVVGNVGCDFRMDFTAIGDTVNTAARLEANAKKGQVLISDVLYERIKDRIEVKEIGNIPLKGKSNGVFVYEVTKILE